MGAWSTIYLLSLFSPVEAKHDETLARYSPLKAQYDQIEAKKSETLVQDSDLKAQYDQIEAKKDALKAQYERIEAMRNESLAYQYLAYSPETGIPQERWDEYRRLFAKGNARHCATGIVKNSVKLAGRADARTTVAFGHATGDLNTTAEEMLAQGQEMFSWIPNAYVKYPCTREGLRAAQMSVQKSIRVNMTLCFSQEQAAAVYAATKGSKSPVYVSPFVGRLDDRGEDGMDLVKNIKKMYGHGDGHVHVLAASIRTISHLLCSFALDAELATVPTKVLDEWAATGFPMSDQNFKYKGGDATGSPLRPIPYKELNLNLPWQNFNIVHELTTKGIQKFVADYQSTLRRSA